MRRAFVFRILLLAALIVAAGHSQPDIAQKRVTGFAAETAAAERAWPAFFKAFRVAVTKRDKVALKEMMVRDFFFSGGGGDDNHDGDVRDDAFKYWDDPNVRGWSAFARALVKGAAPAPPETDEAGKKHPSRVAPPAARTTRNLSTAPPWLAYFEYRNGHWYCMSFSECCD